MTVFRVILVVLWTVLTAYTAVVIARHGMNLLPVFFGDMARLGWPGQFNLDFLCLLTLSGLWTAWRDRFSARGLGLGVLAFFGGAGFLLAYLLILTVTTRGDMARVLLGPRAGRIS